MNPHCLLDTCALLALQNGGKGFSAMIHHLTIITSDDIISTYPAITTLW
ncbi:MAG: hypothetical protein K9N23_07010 [Akkermansiaceae bacterium]|nr:hypothetical protein [Akkermansiaceae bacterium]MCF7731417.1 hypothetical protein [Akkermansiaceae bacterium]